MSRGRIIEALLPDTRTGREEATLRVHVSHLRDVLELSRDGDPKVLLTHGSAYVLDSEAVDLDVDRFDELVREARALLGSQPGGMPSVCPARQISELDPVPAHVSSRSDPSLACRGAPNRGAQTRLDAPGCESGDTWER